MYSLVVPNASPSTKFDVKSGLCVIWTGRPNYLYSTSATMLSAVLSQTSSVFINHCSSSYNQQRERTFHFCVAHMCKYSRTYYGIKLCHAFTLHRKK